MTGNDIKSRIQYVLNDAAGTRYTDAELALWVTDGCLYIATVRPDSTATEATITLAAGTKQSVAGLTPAGSRLLDVLRTTSGGQVVRYVERSQHDLISATWHNAAQSATIRNWHFDARDPRTFWVYPPAIVGTQLDILYSARPTAITAGTLSTTLSIDDVYMDCLTNYVLFRLYAKETEENHNQPLAAMYRAACDKFLETKTVVDPRMGPDLNSPGGVVTKATQAGGL